ncbi:MAG: hypothetical protein A2Y81_12360 [Nitrospirae bacterium RBG_13_43_8]|nr:MAG: hypothetical protein A2Y81_12360 [Nitrospirae bacterium RBG_13_43_8]
MRIVKVWDSDYPWDIRVEKVIKTLSKNGHSVSLICRNLKCLPTFEVMDTIRIFRLPWTRNKMLNHFISFPYFFNCLWLKSIYSVSKNERAEAILVRDLPLALTAMTIGRLLKIPVILDMAENYPAMLRGRKYHGKFQLHQMLLRNAQFAELVECWTLKYVNKIIVVAEENKRRLVAKGVSPDDIYLVSNTPDLDLIQSLDKNLPYGEGEYYLDRFTLIYVGLLGSIRGLEMVIRAMPEIIRKIPEIHLLVIGKGMTKNILVRLVAEKGLGEYVTFKDWVNFLEIPQYLKVVKAGLIPHLSTEHTNTTIPNKIFDYMAHGLPVIASDVAPIKRIIEEEKCGVTFEANNLNDFVNAVVRVYHDRGNSLGENGKRAVSKKYNWKEDSSILLKVFNDLQRTGLGKTFSKS